MDRRPNIPRSGRPVDAVARHSVSYSQQQAATTLSTPATASTDQQPVKTRHWPALVWPVRVWLPAAGAMLAGVYLLILVLAPVPEPPVAATSANWNKPVHTPQPLEDRVYIPRLNLNLAYKSGDKSVLNDALWHRFPDRGNPETGGNYILAGHRFVIGLTPGETIRRSPLYHVGSMHAGDYIYADYHGRRYQYQVTRIYSAKPTATDIEDRSSTDKLTLYTCTLGGEKDGRTVVEGKLVGRQIDPDDILKVSISG